MKRFLLFLALVSASLTVATAGAPQGSVSASPTTERTTITVYTLPAGKLTKAHGLYLIDVWLYFAATLYGFAVLWLVLRLRWMAKFRDLAERASGNRFIQSLIAVPLFITTVSVLLLPPEIYGHHIGRAYGLSVQGWVSWLRDWAVQLIIFAAVGSIVGWVMYAMLRRWPQRAWFYFWLSVIPIAGFLTFAAPVVVDPLFNHFTALESAHPQLVSDLQAVARRAGVEIPASRMFEMNASAKYTGSNAYVTGFGASKRVVVWDTAINSMPAADVMFTFGHELGHYVLDHVVKGFCFAMAYCLVLFYVTNRLTNWAIKRWGPQRGIRGLGDWASLPMLALVGSLLLFISTPGLNAFSRHLEHDADIYGLEVMHGLVPDSPQVAAESFQHLGEEWLEYPYVSKWAEFWLWNHPTNADRVQFAATYDPWKAGQSPKFVK